VRWTFALLVLASCGDNIRMIESGSRLEAIVDVGGEGAEAIAYYRDLREDIDCAFRRDRRSEWRCLPRALVEPAGFADDQCVQPAFECRDCGDDRAAVILEPGCGGAAAVPLALASGPVPSFVRVADICVRAEFPPGSYYTVTSVPEETYVAAAFEDHLVTEQFGTRTLVADDGTRTMFHHAYERAGARDCSFVGGVAGPCLPGTIGSTELGPAFFFADDACSSRAAFNIEPLDARACPPPTHVRFGGEIHQLAAIGPRAFERSPIDSSCAPTEQTDLAFFSIGAVDATLPRADVIALGTGPARPVYYATEDMPLAFADHWVDVDNMPCFPLATVQGRRCIGRSLSLFPADIRYADVTCSIELVPNPEGDLYALRWDGATTAREITEASVVASVHALRAFPATEMYELRDGFCILSPDPAVLMAFVGGPLDLQKFPSVTRRPAE